LGASAILIYKDKGQQFSYMQVWVGHSYLKDTLGVNK
jgi:hypothetical protein